MTGLEIIRAPGTTAEQIADIVAEHCPPVTPEHCDKLSCRECWLAWLATGEPPKEKGPSDKQTAPDEEGLHPNLATYLRQHEHLLGLLDVIIDRRATEAVPWYVTADLNHYIEGHKKAYYEAVEAARVVQEFIDYAGPEKRTDLAARLAVGLGVSPQSFYRYQTQVLEANAWALKLEREDGQCRDYFRALALCRKPKEADTFPSLTPEQRAIIENIWFDKQFASNLGTREMLYEKFEEIARERGWEDYPSIKTVGRYINYLMSTRGATSAHFLAANGTREWRNKMMLKGKRDATTLDVMELLVGDEHTFDLWVQYTAPNGKVKAVRPVLVAWMDMRSRDILGDVICVKANGDTLKESLVKVLYTAGVPKRLLIDNGKDYTKEELTGQNRKNRRIDFDFDTETVGFYQSIGIQGVDRALPYQAWVKAVERLFGTVCSRFSKWFTSYTGTLTGSKTDAKRHKDVEGMLERGELLTMEEFYEVWTEWKEQHYRTRKHRGLTDAKEKWVTPGDLFTHGPRYEKAAPPREYAAMLLMKADTARVTNQGITKFGVLYTDYELCFWKDKKVKIKWDIDDVSKLYVYDLEGHKICEAVSAEVLGFGKKCSQAALEKLMRDQKRQYRESKEVWEDFTTPYEARLEQGRPSDAVGKLDLMIGHAPTSKVIALPTDKEYRGEVAAQSRKKRSGAGDEFLASKAGDALARLRAMNE